MQPYRVIIDTQALVYLTAISKHYPIWDVLPMLFDRLLVPTEVANEFNAGSQIEPERVAVTDAIDQGFLLEKCTRYDSLIVELYKSKQGIDPGEAEALAQQLEIDSNFIWSDDKKFKAQIEGQLLGVRVFNTVHIVAFLELNEFLPDYPSLVKAVHKVRKIKAKGFPHVYKTAAEYLGIKLSTSEIRQKTDFEALGLTA